MTVLTRWRNNIRLCQRPLQFERTVNRDNTVSFQNLTLQIEPVRWRGTLAECTVTAHQHLDGTLAVNQLNDVTLSPDAALVHAGGGPEELRKRNLARAHLLIKRFGYERWSPYRRRFERSSPAQCRVLC